jgi:MFS family permease
VSGEFSLRSLGPGVYVPSALFAVGRGAIAPAVVLSARELGASVGVAGLIVSLIGIGHILGDLPAGAVAARVGDRRAMLWSALLTALALVGCLLATSVWQLALAIGSVGVATTVWHVARHTYLTEIVPYHLRARAMSTAGGTERIGMFIGPFLGAATMPALGPGGAYWVFLVVTAVASVALLLAPDVEPPERQAAAAARSLPTGGLLRGMLQVVRDYRRVLLTLGLGVMVLGAVRASRQVVIPLWGEQIELTPATISIVFGIAGGVDMLLFYPAGKVMDLVGRRAVAVPCLALLGVTHILLPFTHSLVPFTLVAMVMGLGNGLGSGIIMTIGADLSPAERRAEFLGAWRMMSDIGIGAGPSVISAVTVLAALGPALMVMGGIGCLGAFAMNRWIPRFGIT